MEYMKNIYILYFVSFFHIFNCKIAQMQMHHRPTAIVSSAARASKAIADGRPAAGPPPRPWQQAGRCQDHVRTAAPATHDLAVAVAPSLCIALSLPCDRLTGTAAGVLSAASNSPSGAYENSSSTMTDRHYSSSYVYIARAKAMAEAYERKAAAVAGSVGTTAAAGAQMRPAPVASGAGKGAAGSVDESAKAAAAVAAENDAKRNCVWFYLDNDDNEQGPFVLAQLRGWYQVRAVTFSFLFNYSRNTGL
eukprot:SAG31_NODE_122_length_23797_cov_39.343812_26_plen_249_part_00